MNDSTPAKDHYDLGIAAFKKEDYQNAIGHFTNSITLNDKAYIAYQYRAESYIKIKKYEQAILDCSTAISMAPEVKELYLQRGFAYNLLEKYSEMFIDYNSAIALDPEFDRAYLSRGIMYLVINDYIKALPDMEKAVELNKDNETFLKPYTEKCEKELKTNPKYILENIMNNPIVKEQLDLLDRKKKMIKSMKSTDQDEIPWGIGEFGYDRTNPIPVLTSSGHIPYFGQLLTMEGERVAYKRLGSTRAYNIEMPVDIYEISDSKGFICQLYVSMYHKRNSEKAPRNFKRYE
ncbi:MAG: tetratricopeptide repeat protein [Ignavibacteria bacterium]